MAQISDNLRTPFKKLPLEERQAEMLANKAKYRKKAGNPNLKKGEFPYNVDKEKMIAATRDAAFTYADLHNFPDLVRAFLEAKIIDGTPRILRIINKIYNKAMDDKSPFQIQAAQLLLNRAYGKERSADEDLDAIKKGGITVVINRPTLDLEDQKELPAPAPDYIEAEFMEEVRDEER